MTDQSLILARIIARSDDGLRVHLRYANGFFTVFDLDEATESREGDVVFVDPMDGELEAAPPELWQEERWLGVVHSVQGDWTLVDVSGRLLPFPTPEFGLKPEATVLGLGPDRIVEVISDNPLRARTPFDPEGDPAKAFEPEDAQDLDFDDFGGLADVVERAKELIELSLNKRDALKRIGARPIKGVLFTGDPGTGKTMLARIVASKSGAKFFEVSGPEFLSKWYGESERVLRELFVAAKKEKDGSIIFFDEIDSIAGQREGDLHEVSWRIVTSLLTAMDGFDSNENVVVIGATNRPDDLDPALRRPGRFDWEIDFRKPESDDRAEILRVSATRVLAEPDMPYDLIASRTNDWSAADLTAIWSEAALLAVAAERERISREDFAAGFFRVKAIRDRRTRWSTRATEEEQSAARPHSQP